MSYKIALLGNPNCGKTSIYNILTKTFQSVGNRIGVTVSEKEGNFVKDKNIKIIDLPGIYSIGKSNLEESVVFSYLKNNKVDRIINVIDGTNLERNLYLTAEIAKLNIPFIVAVNMSDILKKQGVKLDYTFLEQAFNVKFIEVSAKKRWGILDLVEKAIGISNFPKTLNITEDSNYFIKRTQVIKNLVSNTVINKNKIALSKLDKLFVHNLWGFIVFAFVLVLTYYVSEIVGGFFSTKISNVFLTLSNSLRIKMNQSGQNVWFTDLICIALIKGLGSVFSFLPHLLVLFFCLSILEESGYTSRVAFLTDKIFSKIGLGGKSLISLTLSLGCTVNGITSSRTIEGDSERRLLIMLCPFMPCGAKTAVFGWLSHIFFNGNPFVSVSLYFLGMFCAGIFGIILKNFKPFGYKNDPFLLEIPGLKIPDIKNVLLVLFEKVKEFSLKAGSIIFAVSVIIWFLQNFGFIGYVGQCSKDSFLYVIGDKIKYIFMPLGFGSAEASVSVLTGFLAKEAVIETLEILCDNKEILFSNKFSVYGFMAFVMLSPPCVSALSVAKKELNSNKWFMFMVIFEFFVAYLVAFLINFIGLIIECNQKLLFSLIGVIIILLGIFFIKKLVSAKNCKNCVYCNGERKCLKK